MILTEGELVCAIFLSLPGMAQNGQRVFADIARKLEGVINICQILKKTYHLMLRIVLADINLLFSTTNYVRHLTVYRIIYDVWVSPMQTVLS